MFPRFIRSLGFFCSEFCRITVQVLCAMMDDMVSKFAEGLALTNEEQ